MSNPLDIEIETIEGEKTTLRQLGGSTYLVVNVASACGYTKQYQAMQELYTQKQQEGLLVFPATNLVDKSQEPMKKFSRSAKASMA